MFWMINLFFLVFVCDFVSGGISQPCQYEIQNIEDTVYPHTNVPVGSSVHNLTIEKVAAVTPAPHKRKRGVDTYIPSKYDLILDTNSSYYHLIFVDDHYEIAVKSCLKDGHVEELELFLNETLDEEASCDISVLRIVVRPSIPNFIGPAEVNVSVDTCVAIYSLEVLHLQFEGGCTSWNCSVNSTNDNRLFWIDTGNVIQTSSDNINFNFTYKLPITCFDNDAPSHIHGSTEVDTTGDELVNATFVESFPCTSTTSTITTSILAMTSQTPFSGYFDIPANVAFVSTLGGVSVGVVTGAGLSILVARFCSFSQINGRKVSDEE